MEQHPECNTELGLGIGIGIGREFNSNIVSLKEVKEDEKEITAIKEFQDQEKMIAVPRKKLRLTEDQSAILETSYRDHTTLTQVPSLYQS